MATTSTVHSAIEDLYKVRKGKVELVDVPELGFVMIDGAGAPGGEAFTDALQALYTVSYGAHFAVKKETGSAPRVMPLEALWWMEGADGAAAMERYGWFGLITSMSFIYYTYVYIGTVAAIEQDLMREGFLLRYRTETGVDGLAGDEHPFLACSWWLVSAYAMGGQVDKATELMDRLAGLFNDVGLVSEEYDPERKRMVGNFPQAFSHLAFIGAAHALAQAQSKGSADAGTRQPSDS